ncbi:hypothetical protein GUJ93_ZPchr0011g28045 [Zizania palustris]|uniref:NAC domain-containing protein n=1 Tax=Zizania palustris TaxID=103762 RepID=A0A8J6BKT5_ZIZPA|nr:hypothetical protein GUJ93_ZPchr0011g28045 [Zizania palustris]
MDHVKKMFKLGFRFEPSAEDLVTARRVDLTSREIMNVTRAKIGKTKVFGFQNGGRYTDWLMEEHHSCLQESVAGDEEPVICKIYVSPRG